MIEERKVSVIRALVTRAPRQIVRAGCVARSEKCLSPGLKRVTLQGKVSLGNACSKAPMGRSAIAQGNALGSIGVMVRRPEGAEPNGKEKGRKVSVPGALW